VTIDDYLASGGMIERLPVGATRDYNPLRERNRARRCRNLPPQLSRALAGLRDGDTATTLGERIGETSLNAYQLLRRLHKRGLVTRTGYPARWSRPTDGSTGDPAT
jgi:hypothetical protein